MTTGISITINIPGLGDLAGTASVEGVSLDAGGSPPPPKIDDQTAADTVAEADAPPPSEFAGDDMGDSDPAAPSPPADGDIEGSPVGDDEPPPPGDSAGDVTEADFASGDGGEPPPPAEDIPEARPTAATSRAKAKRARRK